MAAATVTRIWKLIIPAPAVMYTENTTKSHWVTSPAVKAWREASFVYAQQARLPKGLGRVRIDVQLHFTDTRERDALNLHKYVVKPLVDGLSRSRTVKTKKGFRVEVGYGLVPDDNPRHVDGPYPTIGAKVDKKVHPLGLAVVTIADLSEVQS
jgi:hypothetical protein